MYLHKLTIYGFKSFAKRTELTFSKGLSAVVGPNGCGKTNILDAIRWVIGEQKVKALRSASMRDVIFKGSRDHKPLNMAEVLITIRECKGLLPYDPHADTVVIGRRLYRSGDSEYVINGKPVRLKDIQSVLMGTGIGSSIYALIEQSMIQRILAGGKEDRRELLEEAAGIMKYKIDRKAAESKLQSTANDLERLEDILGEVSRNVNSLKRQMRRAQDLKRLKEQSRELAVQIATTRKARIMEILARVGKELSHMEDDLAVANAKRSELDMRRQLVAVERDEREGDVTKIGEALRIEESKIANKEKALAVNTERRGYIEEGLKNTTIELETAKKRLSELEKEMVENSAKIETAFEKNEGLKTESDRLIEGQTNFEASFREIRKATSTLRQEITEARQHLSKTDTGIGSHKGQLESIEKQIAESKQLKAGIEGEITAISDRRNAVDAELEKRTETYERAAKEISDKQDEIDGLNEKVRELNERVSQLESGISGIKGRLEALKESSAPDSTEEQIAGLISKHKIVLGQFSDYIRPGKLSASALDGILGELARAWIVRSAKTAVEIANIIEDKGLSAVLIVLDELPETETDNAVVPKEMSKLLYFVADFGAIESDAENAVSENGAFIRRKGLRRIGTQMRGAISFAQEIEKLGANIDDLEKQLADAEKARKDIFLRRDESNGAFSNMKERENEIRKALSETENEIRELEYRYKSKVSDKADIEKRIENSSARKGEIETELSKLEAGRKSVADRVAELEAEIAKQSEQEIKAEEELRIWTKDATDAQMKFIQAKGELEGLQRELERLRLQYRTAETTIETAERRIRELKDEGERLATEKEKLSEEVQSLVVEKDKKEKEFQTVSENAREANDKLRQLDVELRDITSRASELEKVVHEKRMEKHEQELQAGFIAENLRSDYGIELDSVDIEEKLNSEDERKAQTKLERLKEKITDFGGINPDAEREYEEQKERLDFLTAQREDLVEAKNDLQKTIKKLNNTARRQFLETFEETRRHFKNIFAELFEGGEADLTLQEGEDVLETDIEISARPPGKRFLMINQLSQGEKALCAVSLLFGLYKVKPSPFCMLDEVDAPLDEANVGRFLRMLRRFSDETQFILITHNKRSMEATDYLYGITMQEDGVSKAISLKISDLVLDLEDK